MEKSEHHNHRNRQGNTWSYSQLLHLLHAHRHTAGLLGDQPGRPQVETKVQQKSIRLLTEQVNRRPGATRLDYMSSCTEETPSWGGGPSLGRKAAPEDKSCLLILNLILAQRNAAMLVQEVLPGGRLVGVQLLHIGSRNKALAVVHLHLPPILPEKATREQVESRALPRLPPVSFIIRVGFLRLSIGSF